MKRLFVISSGSKNNAVLIENNKKTILIDCGVSLRSLCTVYKQLSLDISELCAVFVTHSHSDHTKGLATLKKKLTVPFYSGAEVDGCERISDKISLDGFEVTAFSCPHDVDCCGYRVEMETDVFCLATDIGKMTPCILENLKGCQTVMLESNHDIDMLRFGGYPQQLKDRILSDHGHLSNKDCAKTLCLLASEGTLKKAVLAHLSENNNTPLLAKSETRTELMKYGFDVEVYAAEPMLEVIL
ncbi:MAG: MBL fold metallo-hydrolase [Clostridia bacterium]|nr:MBL fold metallo-hydrolase [Clostridia bacterium]